MNELPEYRISDGQVDEGIRMAWNKVGGRKVIVLHDGPSGSLPVHGKVDCRSESLDSFEQSDFDGSVFVYACSWHTNGSRFIRSIMRHTGRFIPVWHGTPSPYADFNATLRKVLTFEWTRQTAENYAKWDLGDFMDLCQAIEITRKVPGAFLEIGCHNGSSGSVAAHYMRESRIGRTAYFFDTFDGFHYKAALASSDAMWAYSHVSDGEKVVAERLKRYEDAEIGLRVVVRHHNIVEEELPEEIDQIAVANVDVDLYEAVLAALVKVAPRVVTGGIIVVEDPGHTPTMVGSRIALEEFMALHDSFLPISLQSGETFLVKTGKQ